jgi:hypothetical protein
MKNFCNSNSGILTKNISKEISMTCNNVNIIYFTGTFISLISIIMIFISIFYIQNNINKEKNNL